MNLKLAALASFLLLVSGCATNEYQSSAPPGSRTRAEVHAEAVEAVKNHKSTLEEEQDIFNPYRSPYR